MSQCPVDPFETSDVLLAVGASCIPTSQVSTNDNSTSGSELPASDCLFQVSRLRPLFRGGTKIQDLFPFPSLAHRTFESRFVPHTDLVG
jgi:hypothetical protein